ncbi:hypothetical protein PanWU01x14_116560, partial [Parasponia andersonii]
MRQNHYGKNQPNRGPNDSERLLTEPLTKPLKPLHYVVDYAVGAVDCTVDRLLTVDQALTLAADFDQ